MPMLADYVPGRKFKGMFIGPPGCGKSLAALSIADYMPPDKTLYYANLDRRIKAPFKYLQKHRPDLLSRIEYDVFQTNQYVTFTETLEKKARMPKYGAFLVDPIWSFGHMLIEYSMSYREEGQGMKRGKLDIAGPDDYKTETRGLNLMFDFADEIKQHFIMTAHYLVTEENDPEDPRGQKKRLRKRILVAGNQIAAATPALFDEVWFLDTKPQADMTKPLKYVCHFKPSNLHPELKTSTPGLPDGAYDWTDKMLFNEKIGAILDLQKGGASENSPETVVQP